MHLHDIETFEDVGQLKLGLFLASYWVVSFEEIKYLPHVCLGLFVIDDIVIRIHLVETPEYDFLHEVALLNIELLQTVLEVEDRVKDWKLLPFDHDLEVDHENVALLGVVVHSLLQVQEHEQHVATVVETNLLLFDDHYLGAHFLLEVDVHEQLKDLIVSLQIQHLEICLLAAVEHYKYVQCLSNLHDLMSLEGQLLAHLQSL